MPPELGLATLERVTCQLPPVMFPDPSRVKVGALWDTPQSFGTAPALTANPLPMGTFPKGHVAAPVTRFPCWVSNVVLVACVA